MEPDSDALGDGSRREKMVARPWREGKWAMLRKLLRHEELEVKEKKDVSGTKKCKVPRAPVFCAKGAEAIESKRIGHYESGKEGLAGESR